jgi:hypothetical protein
VDYSDGSDDHIETWDLLDITLQNQKSDYRRRFGLNSPEPSDPDEARNWRLARQLDALAPALIDSISSLAVSPDAAGIVQQVSPGKPASTGLSGLVWYNVVQERIALELASDAIARLHGAGQRLTSLVAFVREHPLRPAAASFVDRAVRLYLSGFGPECVVMCRSALDAVLCSVMDDDRVATVLGRRPPGKQGFMLNDRIAAARRHGLMDATAVKWAHEIRIWGRDAVHLSPALAPNPTKALYRLIELLENLLPDDAA